MPLSAPRALAGATLALAVVAGLLLTAPAPAQDAGTEALAELLEGSGTESEAAAPATAPEEPKPMEPRRAVEAPRPRVVEEIVVTAQRKEQSLQDVPISVTAFDSETIEKRKISSFGDVAQSTPGFVFAQTFGQVTPTIRGLGADRFTIANEPGVALYVDDIYYGRPYLPQAALTQIERIEILRGPQGTLYGRNTTGGALKIVSKRPSSELEASGGLQTGSFNQVVGQGTVSGPLFDTLAGRFSFYAEDREGYVENRTLDEKVDAHEVFSAQLGADYDAFEFLHLDLNADVTRQNDTGPVAHAKTPLTFGAIGDSTAVPAFSPFDAILGAVEEQFGVVLDPLREQLLTDLAGGRVSDDPRVVFQDAPTYTKIKSRGVAATLGSSLGAVDAKLIGGFRDSRRDIAADLDLTDFPGFAFVPPSFTSGRQTSLELQLSSAFQPPRVGEVRGIAGAFVYDETGREIWTVQALALAPDAPEELGDLVPPEVYPLFQSGGLSRLLFHTRQETRSYAGFADLEWDALDPLLLRFGGRYTADRKRAVGSVQSPDPTSACQDNRESDSWDAFTLRTGADVPWDEDRLFYVSFSQGFKAGGFNPQACNSGPYDPEFVDAIELGMKSRWLDRRLQLNVSGFFYDFTDIQVEKVVGFATEVVNAASAKIRGVELEMVGLLPADLSVDGSLAWLDATYTEFFDNDPFTLLDPSDVDLSGKRVTKSPEWTGSLGAQAFQEIGRLATATMRLEWSYTGSMFYDHFNHDFARAASYQVWNLFLNLERPDSRLGLQGFVKNLADELYVVGQMTPSTLAGGPFTYYSMPRTWGLEVYARF